MFHQRDHAPSGFELDEKLDDIINFIEKRSSVAAPSRTDEDEDYVALSQYEMDIEPEEMRRMTDIGTAMGQQVNNDLQRFRSHHHVNPLN